jgi:hypothetical protein
MKEQLISYLLGELSEEEEILLEEEFFADEEKYLEFDAVQNDLIYSYAQNQLSSSQKEKFENRLKTSPGLQKRVEIAKALSIHIANLETQEVAPEKAELTAKVSSETTSWWQAIKAYFQQLNFAWQFAIVSTSLAVFLGSIWGFLEYQKLKELEGNYQWLSTIQKEELKRLQEKTQQEQKALAEQSLKLTKELSSSKNPEQQPLQTNKTNPNIIPYFLTFIQIRGNGERQKITITPEQTNDVIRLKLKLPKIQYQFEQLLLKKVDESIILTINKLNSPTKDKEGKVLVVDIPANTFEQDDYILQIKATSQNNKSIKTEYSFSVYKK